MEKRRLSFFFRFALKSILPAFAFIIISQTLSAQNRIVGYYPSYRSAISSTQWSCLTDVFYAFATVDVNGNIFIQNSSTTFNAVKAKCYPADPNGPLLWLSIGGANQSGNFSAMVGTSTIASPSAALTNFKNQCVIICNNNNLAGIDVDWEFPTNATDVSRHEVLMGSLDAVLGSKKLCMAVGGEYNGSVNHLNYCTATAMGYCDYINIMTYDFTAPYGNDHSTLYDSQQSIIKWNQKGGGNIMSKLLIGIPFYGRDAGRSVEIMFNELSAANQTIALNSGLSNGSYFNSTATINGKIDWIKAQGGNGVLIWDLGQDASTGTLQNIVCTRMNAGGCTTPTPSLGADVSFCTSGSITIGDAAISTTNRTFSWTKNGSAYTGSTRTISINTAGTYRLTVTEGSCSGYDEIIVTGYSAVSGTSASRCGAGTVALGASGSGTIQWYDALTNGNLLGTGTSYTTPSISSTTNYYVQQAAGSTTNTTGMLTETIANAWASRGDNGSGKAFYTHKITVAQSLTLESVQVYGNTPTYSNARIVLYNSTTGAVVQQTAATNITSSPFTFPVGFVIPAGTYFIGLYVPNATTNGAGLWMHNAPAPAAYTVAGIITIDQVSYEGTIPSTTSSGSYGQLYNWVIKTGATSPCTRTTVTATINSTPTVPGTISGSATPCANGSAQNYTIAAVPGAASYTWTYTGSNVTVSGTSTTGTYTYAANATNGNVSVTANNSCGSSTAKTLAITPVHIPATPGTIGGPATVTQGSSGNAYSITAVPGATSYVWDFTGAGETFTNGTTISPTVAFSGSATSGNITVKASNSCGTSAASSKPVTVTTVTPVTLPSADKVEAYVQPNPFQNDGELVLNVAKNMQMTVIVYDVIGNEKAVILQNQSVTAGEHTYTIPDNLSPGMYLVRIEGDKETQVIKIIKAK